MSVLSPIQRTLKSRCLVYYRADPAVVRECLPPGAEPGVYRGHSLVGLCWTRCVGITGRFLPRRLAPTWDELAYCFPIASATKTLGSKRTGTLRRVWVVRRDTNSRFSAHWASRVLGGAYELAEFRVRETPAALELSVQRNGAPELDLASTAAGQLSGSLFLSTREVEEYLSQCGAIEPRNPLVPDSPELASEGGHWAVDPLSVLRLACPFFEDGSRFPKGSLQLDSAFRLVRLAPARANELAARRDVSLNTTAPLAPV